MLVVSLAGRAAEELVFDTVTTGAANDIEQATRIARAMVTQYGMSEKFGLMGLATQENQYLTGRTVLNCGEATAAEIDTEVMRMLKAAYAEAKRLLSENRDALDKIADFLIEKETITGKEFMRIFRQVKGIPEPPEENHEERNRMGSQMPYPGQNGQMPGQAPYPGQNPYPGGGQNDQMPPFQNQFPDGMGQSGQNGQYPGDGGQGAPNGWYGQNQ